MTPLTDAQQRFDVAKRGWAFCQDDALQRRIYQCAEIAKQLAPDDPRHKTLAAMREYEVAE